jgi:hypothetical protein
MSCGGHRYALNADATAPRKPTPTKLRVRTRIRADAADLVPLSPLPTVGSVRKRKGL